MSLSRLLCLAALGVACDEVGSPDSRPAIVLVRVDTVAITDSDFERAVAKLDVSGADNTLEQWRRRLQILIDRQLLLIEARKRGFYDDPDLLSAVAQWRRSQLLKSLLDRQIGANRPGEDEVRDFFLQSGAGREVEVGRLVIAGRARAEEAHHRARSGDVTFEDLRARYLPASDQASAGGHRRWLSTLSVKEPLLLALLLSGPGSAELVAGEQGYTLLVAVAEHEVTFEQRREQAELALAHRRRIEASRALVARLTKKYGTSINRSVSDRLRTDSTTGPDQVLVRSSVGDWTVGEYRDAAASLAARDRSLLDRDSSFELRIFFAFALDQLIDREAREVGLQPVSAADEQMERDRRAIEALWSEEALSQITVTQAEIREYFARNRQRYPSELSASGGAAAVWQQVTRELKEERAQPMFSVYVVGLRSRYESLVEIHEDRFFSLVSRLRRDRAPVQM